MPNRHVFIDLTLFPPISSLLVTPHVFLVGALFFSASSMILPAYVLAPRKAFVISKAKCAQIDSSKEKGSRIRNVSFSLL